MKSQPKKRRRVACSASSVPHEPGIGAFIRRDDLIDTTRIWAWHLRDDDKDARRTKILNGIVDQVSLSRTTTVRHFSGIPRTTAREW